METHINFNLEVIQQLMYSEKDLLDILLKSRNNALVVAKCPYCQNLFNRKIRDIRASLRMQRYNSVGCSKKCTQQANIKSITINCKSCNKHMTVFPYIIRNRQYAFCSQSCSATYNNKHKIKGFRVSKLEKYIVQKIKDTYGDICVQNTRSILKSGLELDIYIPSLHIAFEINGIHHYKPIYGYANFNKTVLNDSIKVKECIEQNIKLVIIDTQQQTKFTEDSSKEYWHIVKEKIESYR